MLEYFSTKTRLILIKIIPLFYVMILISVFIPSWFRADRLFSVRKRNFLVQGQWEDSGSERNLADIRVDFRYGYFPLGKFKAIKIIDTYNRVYYPELIGYQEITEKEFEVQFSHGLHVRFISLGDDGIAISALQDEMSYQVKHIIFDFVPNPDFTFIDSFHDLSVEHSRSYSLESELGVSSFNEDRNQLILSWVDENVGFDRLSLSNNFWGSLNGLQEWLDVVDLNLLESRYEQASQRYMENIYLSENTNKYEGFFSVPSILARVEYSRKEGTMPYALRHIREEMDALSLDFPIWLVPWSGRIVEYWSIMESQRVQQENTWKKYLSEDTLFANSDKYLYIDMAIKSPNLLSKATESARTIQQSDTIEAIMYKIHFLLWSLDNRQSNENLLALESHLNYIELFLRSSKRGIYIFDDNILHVQSMILYIDILSRIIDNDFNIQYKEQHILRTIYLGLFLGLIEFTSEKGEIPRYIDWNNGFPKSSDSYLGSEHLYLLFNSSSLIPRILLASSSLNHKIVSAVNINVVRNNSTGLELELELRHDTLDSHYLVITNVKNIIDAHISDRKLEFIENLDNATEAYFYDKSKQLLFIKIEQKDNIQLLSVRLEESKIQKVTPARKVEVSTQKVVPEENIESTTETSSAVEDLSPPVESPPQKESKKSKKKKR